MRQLPHGHILFVGGAPIACSLLTYSFIYLKRHKVGIGGGRAIPPKVGAPGRRVVGGSAREMHVPLTAHPLLERGVLPNGLRYAILPVAAAPWAAAPWSRRRVAVHLEVHVGSIDEAEHERGFAHLLEHASFMGSRRRLRLSGTGARLAALTDFRSTGYTADVPRSGLG